MLSLGIKTKSRFYIIAPSDDPLYLLARRMVSRGGVRIRYDYKENHLDSVFPIETWVDLPIQSQEVGVKPYLKSSPSDIRLVFDAPYCVLVERASTLRTIMPNWFSEGRIRQDIDFSSGEIEQVRAIKKRFKDGRVA